MFQPSRHRPLIALVVLLLHVGLGLILLQLQRLAPQPAKALVATLRLVQLPSPPRQPDATPQATAQLPRRRAFAPVPEVPANPGERESTAISVGATPAPPSAATAPASGPLNLTFPSGWKPAERLSPAQQAVHDPRANSPRYSASEQLARRMGNEAETIELAGGGTMTRRPDGSCTRTLPNRANALVPMDPHLQGGLAHGGACFNDKPGDALQHARPR